MSLDPLLLSRIQFGFVVSFHIIFPAFTIGLAAWLATIEGMRLATGSPVYRRVFDFWQSRYSLPFMPPSVLEACMHDWRYATPDAPHRPLSDERKRPRSSGLLRWLVVCAAVPIVSCSQQGILDPQGPIASAQQLLLINSTEIMLVVVVPVILATLGFAWWYRSSNPRAKRSEELAYEGRIDFVVWSIPALIVILLGGVNWISSHELDPRAPIAANAKPLEVDVVSLDWKWLFIYPDQGIAALNQLVIPAGTPINFRLTSATVMNSFFVPQLGSQIYTMPGMTTHLNLLADRLGEFPGISANFSGNGFADMRFTVKAVPAGDFDGWVAQVRGSGSALDIPGYTALAKPSQAVPPTTFRAVEPKLFERIIDETTAGSKKLRTTGACCPPAPQAGG
jgi:cytochrome o ubiquinol oxidase subunit 2